MKYTIKLFLAIFFVHTMVPGHTQNSLEEKKGFQDIKLGSDITKYEGLQYKKDLKDKEIPESKLYVAKGGFYKNVGDIRIYKLEVKSFQDTIFEINILAEKNPDFYRALEKNFGKGNYSIKTNAYEWNSKSVKLLYQSHNKKKVQLTYYYRPIKKIVKEAQKEDIEDIADDF